MGIRQKLGVALRTIARVPLGVSAGLLYAPASHALTTVVVSGLDSTASFQEARVRAAIDGYLDMASCYGHVTRPGGAGQRLLRVRGRTWD